MTLRLASTSALRATADKSTSALPPSRSALRRTSRAPADKPRSGGQAALGRTSRATADRSLAQGKARLIFVAAWTAAFVAIVGNSSVFACPVCFAAEETSMINGTRIGILVLLAVTLVVQGAFVGFFLYLRKRAKHIADVELDTEWSELQRATR